jgi:hypothetical protein
MLFSGRTRRCRAFLTLRYMLAPFWGKYFNKKSCRKERAASRGCQANLYVPPSGGKTSTLNITSLTDFALAGNRGKDPNRASQFGQCQRWRMILLSKSSVACGAMISWLHRTHRIPNMNMLCRFFILLSLCHAGRHRTAD